MYFCYFVIISPWKMVGPLHFYKLKSPSSNDALCQVCLKLVKWFLRIIFFNFVKLMYFCYFVIISPWERAGPLHLVNLNPLHQGCFVPSLVESGTVVLEKKIFNFFNVFSLFRNYLPLEKGGALLLNELESPSPYDDYC